MQLTWYGHSTWSVSVGETALLIDRSFDNPMTDIDPEEIDPDYVLLTHGLADNVTDVDRYGDTMLVATPELVDFARDNWGDDEAVGGAWMNLGGTVTCGDPSVSMVRADHTNGIQSG